MSIDQTAGWRFSQYFGVKLNIQDIQEPDLLSSIEFDDSGEFLATGDYGGRIVIFQRSESPREGESHASPEYHFYSEFQSHVRKFDYLSSMEIPERINTLQWAKTSSNTLLLLSTNDRVIKLWKIRERESHFFSFQEHSDPHEIYIPTVISLGKEVVAANKAIYIDPHLYTIHSLSCFNDGETFLSADDLRINLWNLDQPRRLYNIMDLTPPTMEGLNQVLTSISCHPTFCSVFGYSTSKGDLSLCDLRVSSKCFPIKIFQSDHSGSSKFKDITSSISSMTFTHEGRNLIARDYTTVHVWDLRYPSKPYIDIPVQPNLESDFESLCENDILFDRFKVTCNPNGTKICTGSYQSYFQIMNIQDGSSQVYEASRKSNLNNQINSIPTGNRSSSSVHYNIGDPEFLRTINQVSWHPKEDILALSSLNNLYIFADNH